MSGGHFEYAQFHISNIAEGLKEDIRDCIEDRSVSEKTISEMQTGLRFLRLAYIYAQRIDWFMSGDDGEETFHKRLKADLKEQGLSS